ncbi:MAG: PEP-CTERM sorting domain-containing protein [Thermoguttaceae bacterium]|jgi:hypothetical protein
MSIRIFVRVPVALLVFWFCMQAYSAVPVLWQTTLQSGNYPETPNRLLFTPDGSKLLVSNDSHTSTAWLTELDPATDTTVSPWPKSVGISGMDLCATWIDNSGNIYLGSGWGGYNVYKYDSTLTTKTWQYTNSTSAFEYVRDVITDSAGNVYAGGAYGSGSNVGAMMVKLSSSGNLLKSVSNKNTTAKDTYDYAMTLSPDQSIIYRGGSDTGFSNTGSRGRVYGNYTSNLSEALNWTTPETATAVNGLATDSSNYLYVAYLANCDSNGNGQPYVRKINSAGVDQWSTPLQLPVTGGFLQNSLVKVSDNAYVLGFNQVVGSTHYVGLAKFNSSGQLLGMDKVDSLPGNDLCSLTVGPTGKAYLGLASVSSGWGGQQQSKAIAVNIQSLAYDRKLNNTYHAQQNDYYCGPATAQMILDSDAVHANPVPTQDNIYAQIRANNSTDNADINDWSTDPNGLKGALAHYDTAHNYVAYNMTDFNAATRTLAYNIDHYGVPAGALVKHGQHWINVRGVNSNVQPTLTGANANFTVNGFYVRDPWTGLHNAEGLGIDAYIANTAGGWQSQFTTIRTTDGNGTWNGNYAFVTDPDVAVDTSNSAPTSESKSIPDLASAVTEATSDISSISGMAGDLSFLNGVFSTLGGQEITMHDGTCEWLVPYYQNGATDPSGTVLINAATGDLDQAFWTEGVLTGMSLSDFTSYIQTVESGTFNTNEVPEPSTLVLFAVCSTSLFAYTWRRKRTA